MSCACTPGDGMPEGISEGYAAACHVLRDGDSWIDGGCNSGRSALAVQDHLRDAHRINVTVIGIDTVPTGEMYNWMLRPDYDGGLDHHAMTEAAAKSRAALDRFIQGDICEVSLPEGSADVVTCFSLGGGPDSDRAAHAALAGFLKDGGTAVFGVDRPSAPADALRGHTRPNEWIARRLCGGSLRPVGAWCDAHLRRRRITPHALLWRAAFRWPRLRKAMRRIDVKVMTKSEALKHAAACGPQCAHGEMVDFY